MAVKMMNILIDRVEFENKGSELMLRTIVIELQKSDQLYQIVLPRGVYLQNIGYCVENNILPLYGKLNSVKSKIYHRVFKRHPYILPSEIDVILDAAGLRFTDEARLYYKNDTENLKKYYQSFTKPSLKIFFLPQSFGPFKEDWSQQQIKIVFNKAAYLYPREQISLAHLQEVFGRTTKIAVAPDFTCLYKPDVPMAKLLPLNTAIIIVPNTRMITHGQSEDGEYMLFLKSIVQNLIDKREQVILLNHQGDADEKILLDLNTSLSVQLPILTNLNAIEVKAIIGRAKLLISSRFHGVVSGLSQGVPTLCTGWSHKYGELLKDYEMSSICQLNIGDIESSYQVVLEALECPENYRPNQMIIETLENRSKQMFKEVFEKM